MKIKLISKNDIVSFYGISCNSFTVGVEVNNDGIIIKTSGVLKRFVGQRFDNLKKWLEKINEK